MDDSDHPPIICELTKATGFPRRRPSFTEDQAEGWNGIFATSRDVYPDNIPFVDILRDVGVDGDDLDIFLSPNQGPVPSCELEDIKKFCCDAKPLSRTSRSSEKQSLGKAWLDERERSTGKSRSHPVLLSAIDLYERLKQPRFGLEGAPDADRRLIYIPNLSPDYILALTAAAPYHQSEALRKAIWKHITLQTAIGVNIPTTGFIIFCLEFHIPYFVLRTSSTPVANLSDARPNNRPRRERVDVFFLASDSIGAHPDHSLIMHDAMTSVVLCGSDDSRWVAYAFVDTEFSGVPCDEYEDDDEWNEDPIASDRTGATLEASTPIYNPREYFLRIVNIRMEQVLLEWRYIVGVVDGSIKDRRTANPLILSRENEATPECIREEFNWTIHMIYLLRMLQERFSMLFEAWERFNSPRGDIQYFVKVPGPISDLALKGIKVSFQELMDLERRLRSLGQKCETHCKILNLRFNFESQRMNHESYKLNHRTHLLNLRNSVLSNDGHRVTIETKRVALENQETAKKTNQTAQLTLSMNIIVSSITIVIAYFSTPQAIFRFDRNAKTFVVLVPVVVTIFKLVNQLMALFDRYEPGERLKALVMAPARRRAAINGTAHASNPA